MLCELSQVEYEFKLFALGLPYSRIMRLQEIPRPCAVSVLHGDGMHTLAVGHDIEIRFQLVYQFIVGGLVYCSLVPC